MANSKVKPYSYVNPSMIKVIKSPISGMKKSLGFKSASATKGSLNTEHYTKSSRVTLLGLNRVGGTAYTLGKVFQDMRDNLKGESALEKHQQQFEKKKKQFQKDQASEAATEEIGKKAAKDAVDKEDVKKEGKKELGWLESLLGPFKGIFEFAIRTIITQGVLRWISDPANGERITKVVNGLKTYFGAVFSVAGFAVDKFMSGLSAIFGDGSKTGFARFGEVMGGFGSLLLGLVGLKALGYMLNPFSLAADIVGLANALLDGSKPTPAAGAGGAGGVDDAAKASKGAVDDAAKAAGKKGFLQRAREIVGGGAKRLRSGINRGIGNTILNTQIAIEKGRKAYGAVGEWAKRTGANVNQLRKLATDPKALFEYVKGIIGGKVEGAIKNNELVKRLYNAMKNPKQMGSLIKDALKSKQALKTVEYLKQVQKGAKIGGIDKVIAAITALLEYGLAGTPFVNAFLGAIGGLLGYAGGFALGAPFGGLPGFISGAAGGIAGEMAGRALARLLGRGALGSMKDPLMNDGRMLADPALFAGGIITKPTRAVLGERGPEAVVPLGMMGGMNGSAEIASAVLGALGAMGPSGAMAKKFLGPELAKLTEGLGPITEASPGTKIGTVSTTAAETKEAAADGDMSKLVGTGNDDPNTLRGQLKRLLDVFEAITKKDFESLSGTSSGGGGSTDDGGTIDTSGIAAATGSVTDKGAAIAKKFMSNLGITKEAAAAIAGNFAHESGGFIPGIREGGPFGKNSKPWPKGTVGKGYGWAQWTNSAPGDRYDKFIQSYGGDYNKIPSNEDNLKFAIQEMKGSNPLSASFKKSTDVASSAVWFRKNWERAGVHHDGPRISYAKGILAKMSSGGKLTPSLSTGGAFSAASYSIKPPPSPGPSATKASLKARATQSAKSTGSSLSSSSATVAVYEEQKQSRMTVVPVPMPTGAINNSSAAPAPRRVVRARQPITTGI